MIFDRKPGAADGKKDRIRHTKYEYKSRHARGDETIQKVVYGLLSKVSSIYSFKVEEKFLNFILIIYKLSNLGKRFFLTQLIYYHLNFLIFQKEQKRLIRCTNDNFSPGVYYSLKKQRRWESCLSTEKVIDAVIPKNNTCPIIACKFDCGNWEKFCRDITIKFPMQDVEKVNIKSGKGADFCCLYNNVRLKGKRKEKPSRGPYYSIN